MSWRPRVTVGGRLTLALLLTLGPTLALGYIGYRAVAEREQSLRTTYAATGSLVRDRLTTELDALDAALRRNVLSSHTPDNIPDLQAWLRALTQDHSWIADPFFVTASGGIVTAQLWLDWPHITPEPSDSLTSTFRDAENAEFRQHDLNQALTHYRRALAIAASPNERAAAASRVGRTLFKLQRFDEGLDAYRVVLTLPPDAADTHGLPYTVMALSQIHDGLDVLGHGAERQRAASDLQRALVEHPWDVGHGYAYYVNQARRGDDRHDAALTKRLTDIGDAIATIEWLKSDVQPRLGGDPGGPRGENRDYHVSVVRRAAPVPIGVQTLPGIDGRPASARLGFVIRAEDVSGPLLSGIVAGVGLGSDIRVLIAPDNRGEPTPLASASLGDRLPGWSVAIVDVNDRTIEQLTARERWSYGGLVAGVLAVLVVGVVFTTRAWARQAELSRLQNDFVSNVSHELKTPLALIRMFGETLESGLVDDASKRQEFYGIIRRESERLTHLINNVLDTAKIEAGTKQFTFRRGDVVALVHEALEAYAPLFTRLNFAVETSLPSAPLPVNMDRDAVAQSLVNLFQNAIRYSGDAKHVAVAVSERDAEVTVTVADRGVGIPDEDLPRIFDKFYRSRASTMSDTPGSGLGLSIVTHVMKAHGGRVEVESAIGRGSVFTLVFPFERSAA